MAEQNQATIKCARLLCVHSTETPSASGWIYMDRSIIAIARLAIMRCWPALSLPMRSTAPTETPEWVGWWCSRCIRDVSGQKALAWGVGHWGSLRLYVHNP